MVTMRWLRGPEFAILWRRTPGLARRLGRTTLPWQ
jgi:hypothetical protein